MRYLFVISAEFTPTYEKLQHSYRVTASRLVFISFMTSTKRMLQLRKLCIIHIVEYTDIHIKKTWEHLLKNSKYIGKRILKWLTKS